MLDLKVKKKQGQEKNYCQKQIKLKKSRKYG